MYQTKESNKHALGRIPGEGVLIFGLDRGVPFEPQTHTHL